MGPPPTGKKKRELLPCTRYGPVHSPVTKLGTEERFAWQKPQFSSDVMYELPPVTMSRVVSFPSAVRGGMDDLANPDAKKRSTGPGSYNPETCFDRLSDYCVHRASRFADAPRQSMDMKTPSPGAVYNVEKCYWNGPVKTIGISFNKDQRPPLYNPSLTADADMLWPQLPNKKAITIAGRLKHKDHSQGCGSGIIYDVKRQGLGPSFSFGRGRASRFSSINFLPEID